MKKPVHIRYHHLLLAAVFAFICLFYRASIRAAPLSDIQAWKTQKDLLKKLASPAVVEQDGYIYVIGGKDEHDNPVDRVESLDLKDNNANWQLLPALPVPLYLHAAVKATVNSQTYIYVIGGWDGENWRSDVWYTEINGTGDINGWTRLGDYKAKVTAHDAVVVNDSLLYVLGGENEKNEILKTVAFAVIKDNGTLEQNTGRINWTTATELPKPLDRLSAVTYKDTSNSKEYIYVTGGYDGTHAQKSVYYAEVILNNSDPKQSKLDKNWSSTTELKEAVYYHKVLIYPTDIYPTDGDQLYILGGKNDDSESSTIYNASINSIPSKPPTLWQSKYGLVESLYRFAAVSTSTGVYVIGGLHNNDYRDKIYSYTPPGFNKVNLTGSQVTNATEGNNIVTYTLHLANGSDPLTNITVSNTVPAGVTVLSDSFSADPDIILTHQGTNPGDYLNWQLNLLAANVQKTITYRVQRNSDLDAQTPIFNSGASITWTYQGNNSEVRSNAIASPAYYLPLIAR